MIVTKEELGKSLDELICINVGRTDIIDETRYKWKQVHDFIKNCDAEIVANGVFYLVDEYINKGEVYRGGGMQYNFWFKNAKDAREFTEVIAEEFGKEHVYAVLKYLNENLEEDLELE